MPTPFKWPNLQFGSGQPVSGVCKVWSLCVLLPKHRCISLHQCLQLAWQMHRRVVPLPARQVVGVGARVRKRCKSDSALLIGTEQLGQIHTNSLGQKFCRDLQFAYFTLKSLSFSGKPATRPCTPLIRESMYAMHICVHICACISHYTKLLVQGCHCVFR